jgi:hypothetical protein
LGGRHLQQSIAARGPASAFYSVLLQKDEKYTSGKKTLEKNTKELIKHYKYVQACATSAAGKASSRAARRSASRVCWSVTTRANKVAFSRFCLSFFVQLDK